MTRKIKGNPSAIFLHIPRTGGTFIEEALKVCYVKTSRFVKNKTREGLSVPKKHILKKHFRPEAIKKVDHFFAFVRDPADYYPSVWAWLQKHSSEKIFDWDWHPFFEAYASWDEDFNHWAMKMTRNEPGWAYRLFEAYCGPKHNPICSYVGKTETISEDFCEFAGQILYYDTKGWPRILEELGKKNVAKRTLPQWKPYVLDAVIESEAAFYQRWG